MLLHLASDAGLQHQVACSFSQGVQLHFEY